MSAADEVHFVCMRRTLLQEKAVFLPCATGESFAAMGLIALSVILRSLRVERTL